MSRGRNICGEGGFKAVREVERISSQYAVTMATTK